MEKLLDYGFVAIVSFGLTYIVNSIYLRLKGQELSRHAKMIVQGLFAFLLLFVPMEFQNAFLDQLKIAVGVVAGSSALWQVVKAL